MPATARLVFESDEFIFVEPEEKDAVPPELRTMFDSAWIDLSVENPSSSGEGFIGYAMAATYTGVLVTVEDLRNATQSAYHRVRALTYFD